ncbi:MAG: aldehyde dehydrogenase family protein [Firmicutes bacterium]|nr:aldehyde dehydrogenase family protein [Bacillota bacterium]
MYREIFAKQKEYFIGGNTLDIEGRKAALINIKKMIIKYESDILEALKLDLNKSPQEAYITEILPAMTELDYAIKNIKKWTNEKKCKGTIFSPFSSYSVKMEPKGVVLIVSPFNYPFQLSLIPVISAIAAGNTLIMKVSELSSYTGRLLVKMFNSTFEPELIYCTDVEPDNFEDLFELEYNHIFFTGSTRIGKEIYGLGKKNLATMTLELGGKSPVIVHKSANLKLAARKIIWGKFLNGGQTCIAPDYLLVDKSIRVEFISLLVEEIKTQFNNALMDDTFVKIIHKRHFARLVELIDGMKVAFGGAYDESTLKFEPTIIEEPPINSRLMREEIFGPILPIMYFENSDEILEIVKKNPDPLALYIFSEDKGFNKFIIDSIPSGGCCINDVLVHLMSVDAPFGGRGNSGLGNYHGLYGFKTFSHEKCICRSQGWFDMKLRYLRGDLSGFINILKKFKGW